MRERDLFFRKKNANVILALHFLLFHVLKSTREFMRIYSIKLYGAPAGKGVKSFQFLS